MHKYLYSYYIYLIDQLFIDLSARQHPTNDLIRTCDIQKKKKKLIQTTKKHTMIVWLVFWLLGVIGGQIPMDNGWMFERMYGSIDKRMICMDLEWMFVRTCNELSWVHGLIISSIKRVIFEAD